MFSGIAHIALDSAQPDEFSGRVAILWYANLNSDKHNPLKARIRPPKMRDGTVGVFATRGVHRPSSLGLTMCDVTSLSDSLLSVSGADMIEGTPILAIVPLDAITSIQSLISVRSPAWIGSTILKIEWSIGAYIQSEQIGQNSGVIVSRMLSHDPRSHHSIHKHEDPIYEVSVGLDEGSEVWVIYQHLDDSVRILFLTRDRIVSSARSRTEAWLSRLLEIVPYTKDR